MDYIIAGTVTKADVQLVLTDHDEDVGIPSGEKGWANRRYSLFCTWGGYAHQILKDAGPLKKYLGNSAYYFAMNKMMLLEGSLKAHQYDVEVDG